MRIATSLAAAMGLLAMGLFAVGVHCVSAQGDGSGARDSDHLRHHDFTPLAKVPEKARTRGNPLEGDPNARVAGKKLFAQHCAECHGENAEGGRKAPNLRAEEIQNATPGTLFWIMTNGVVRGGMPVWSKLPEPQRWQIVAFLKSLPASANAEPAAEHLQEHRIPKAKAEAKP